MNAAGNWTRGYVYGESGGLTAIQQPEGYVEWVTQDPVTKGQRITNSQGAVTASLEFDPFGGETSKSSNSYRQPQKYTTYTRDSNGTDDAMHRRYSGFWSRFQQPDPYDGSYDLTNPQSFNRYAYVGNDPVNFTDPSGLFEIPTNDNAGDDDVIVFPTSRAFRDAMEALWSLYFHGLELRAPLVMPVMSVDEGVYGISIEPLRPDVSDRDTFAVNSALNLCGAAASLGEYSTVNGAGTKWRGNNGQWNRMGWGGNGSTGARSAAIGRANGLKLLGKASFGVGAGFSVYQGVQAYQQGDKVGAAKSGLDIGMGVVGLAGGPYGAAISGGYSAVDMTIGWGEVGKFLQTPLPKGCGYANAKVGSIPQ